MKFETSRLILRLHTFEDFEDYYAYIMDRELQHMLGMEWVADRDCAIVAFQWLLDNVEFLAVVDKTSGKVIGHICIHPPYKGIAEQAEYSGKKGGSLSFAVAKQEQRRGLMLEALQALMKKLFLEDGFDYLDCEYTSFNTASAALQKKLGFRYWGTEQLEDVTLIVNVKERGDQ